MSSGRHSGARGQKDAIRISARGPDLHLNLMCFVTLPVTHVLPLARFAYHEAAYVPFCRATIITGLHP